MKTTLVNDALWRCLCPSFSHSLLKRTARRRYQASAQTVRSDPDASHIVPSHDQGHNSKTSARSARQDPFSSDSYTSSRGSKSPQSQETASSVRAGFGTIHGTKWGIQSAHAERSGRGTDRPRRSQDPHKQKWGSIRSRAESELRIDRREDSVGPDLSTGSPYSALVRHARRFEEDAQDRIHDTRVRNAGYQRGRRDVTEREKYIDLANRMDTTDLDRIQRLLNPTSIVKTHENQDLAEQLRAEIAQTRVNGDLASASDNQLYVYLRKASNRGLAFLVTYIIYTLIHDRGHEPSLYLYNAQILSLAHEEYGSAAVAEAIFEEIRAEGILPDSNTYHAMLRVLAVHPDYCLRAQLLEEMKTRWIDITSDGWHSIVAGQIREVQPEMALNTLEDMQRRSIPVQSWLVASFLYQLCDLGELDAVLHLIRQQISIGRGGDISNSQWQILLDMAIESLHYPLVRLIWAREVVTRRATVSSGQIVGILHTAARQGDAEMATKAYEMLTERDTPFSSYNTELLIQAYSNSGDAKTPLTILCVMDAAGAKPDFSATRTIRKAILAMQDPIEAWEHLRELHSEGRQIPMVAPHVVLEAILDKGAKAGEEAAAHKGLTDREAIDSEVALSSEMRGALDTAFELYKTMHNFARPDTETYDLLLRGCREARRKDLAVLLATEMLHRKLKPTSMTYDRLILVCLNDILNPSESLEDAFRYWREMRSKKMVARAGTAKGLMERLSEHRDPRAVMIWRDCVKTLEQEGLGVEAMGDRMKARMVECFPRVDFEGGAG